MNYNIRHIIGFFLITIWLALLFVSGATLFYVLVGGGWHTFFALLGLYVVWKTSGEIDNF